MANGTWYERLNPTDATFLHIEDARAHMHVGGIFIYQGRPPPIRDCLAYVESRLDRVPRYRQRLQFVPFGAGRPVWVDDQEFDIEHHVRHSALPGPGGEEALKRAAARIFAQPLDPSKPLWELELVEGVDDDHFAVVSKTHHCVIDGIAGNGVIEAITDAEPMFSISGFVPTWTPRPPPSPATLLAATLRDQISGPVRMAREALQAATDARKMLADLRGGLEPLLRVALRGRAPESSLNGPVGRQRRYEMATLDLASVKHVRGALGIALNDVMLAVVAGALRKFLMVRGEKLRDDLRVFVPVNARAPDGSGSAGNQVAAVFCPIPLTENDPVARARKISAAMNQIKQSNEAMAALSIARLGELSPPPLAFAAARLEVAYRRFNFVVSNVPGFPTPRYFLGRKLVRFHPLIPLSSQQLLSVGLHSYAGTIGFGLAGDADRMRDLAVFARAIPEALEELVLATGGAVAALADAAARTLHAGVAAAAASARATIPGASKAPEPRA